MTFKSDIYQICSEVAAEFPDWSFTSTGVFKNKTLKHTDLIVDPGLFFTAITPSCSTQPWVMVKNKKVAKLFKQILGNDRWTLGIDYQMELEDYYLNNSQCVMNIFPEKIPFNDSHGVPQEWPKTFIVQTQAKDYLRRVLADGIGILKKYFDYSSEENLLRNLPAGQKQRDGYEENAFYEMSSGIAHCLAAIVLGNFDFVERYASDDFITLRPKREAELKKILAALPELKRKFAETGKVI